MITLNCGGKMKCNSLADAGFDVKGSYYSCCAVGKD
jgi:hypothetical protein